jgi:hypothetical protein
MLADEKALTFREFFNTHEAISLRTPVRAL